MGELLVGVFGVKRQARDSRLHVNQTPQDHQRAFRLPPVDILLSKRGFAMDHGPFLAVDGRLPAPAIIMNGGPGVDRGRLLL